jgi:hypothetical protein
VLEAWYEWVNCEESARAAHRDALYRLLDEAIADTTCSRQELLEALGPRFRDYSLARRKEHQARMDQALRGRPAPETGPA